MECTGGKRRSDGCHVEAKRTCKHIRIEDGGAKGRVVVASKDFKKGEVIFEETPFVFSNHAAVGDGGGQNQMLCLGCTRPIMCPYRGGVATHEFVCKCGSKFCQEACLGRQNGRHDQECRFLRKTFTNIKASKLVFYVRALATSADPHKWSQMCSFVTHPDLEAEDLGVDLAKALLDTFGPVISADDIQMLRRVDSANSWTLGLQFPLDADARYGFTIAKWPLCHSSVHGEVTCLGLTLCIVEHSCAPNAYPTAWYSPDGIPKIVCRAAVDIRKGDNVSFSYMSSKQLVKASHQRICQMVSTKRFTCECSRCSDATDGAAYTSSLCCTSCRGFFLPPVDPKDAWTCSGCCMREHCMLVNDEVSQQQAALCGTVTSRTALGERREVVARLQHLLKPYLPRLPECHYVLFSVNEFISIMLGLISQPLLPSDCEALRTASLSAVVVLARLTRTSTEDLGMLYFHAARGSAGRSVDKEPEKWNAHFNEVVKLLLLARDQFRAVLGPEHDLTDTAEAFVKFCLELADVGPTEIKGIGHHPDPSFLLFLGQELCDYMGA